MTTPSLADTPRRATGAVVQFARTATGWVATQPGAPGLCGTGATCQQARDALERTVRKAGQ